LRGSRRAKAAAAAACLAVVGVLAIAAMLLIPIGALGIPASVDLFGRDRPS
jgi:hypothetical protein